MRDYRWRHNEGHGEWYLTREIVRALRRDIPNVGNAKYRIAKFADEIERGDWKLVKVERNVDGAGN